LYAERTMYPPDYNAMLAVALEEARIGLAEGGLPIGAAIFRADGTPSGELVSRGRNAGRQRSYRDLIMVTTLAPCWYCSGLVKQFGFQTVVLGESINFSGGEHWLRELGINVIDLANADCIAMMRDYIAANPTVWKEDIGVD
jgi:creatinine deaminase